MNYINKSETCETVVVNGVVYNKGDEPKEEKKPVVKRGRKPKA